MPESFDWPQDRAFCLICNRGISTKNPFDRYYYDLDGRCVILCKTCKEGLDAHLQEETSSLTTGYLRAKRYSIPCEHCGCAITEKSLQGRYQHFLFGSEKPHYLCEVCNVLFHETMKAEDGRTQTLLEFFRLKSKHDA